MGTAPRFTMKDIAAGDPYLLWLVNTGERFLPTELETVLFVHFAKEVDKAVRAKLADRQIRISPLYDGYTYATVRLPRKDLQGRVMDLVESFGATCISL